MGIDSGSVCTCHVEVRGSAELAEVRDVRPQVYVPDPSADLMVTKLTYYNTATRPDNRDHAFIKHR